jgi:hypothetical protein
MGESSLVAGWGGALYADDDADRPLLLSVAACEVDAAANADDGGATQRPGTRILVVCTLLAALATSFAVGCANASLSSASSLALASGRSDSMSSRIVDRFAI